MAAVVLWGVVAVASVTRLIVPSLVELFRREPVRTRDGGQWWRVLTAGLVEDGGVVVTAANLVLLAVVAIAAVRSWGWYRAAALFVVGQILWGLFTTFVSPSVGAGTSGATLALAASIAGLLLTTEAIVVEKKEDKPAPAAGGVRRRPRCRRADRDAARRGARNRAAAPASGGAQLGVARRRHVVTRVPVPPGGMESCRVCLHSSVR
mgnify:CR=1 FL=1